MEIVVLEDHPMVCQGLETIIRQSFPNSRINHFDNLNTAMADAVGKKYDLAIVDLNLKGCSGFEYIKQSKIQNTAKKHLVFTSSAQMSDYRQAMLLDVEGYLLKECMPEDLVYAINTILKGRRYVDSIFLKNQFQEDTNPVSQLTEREVEILSFVGKGHSNFEIADQLFISSNTVKKHITHIFEKMQFKDRTQAVIYWQENKV